MLLVDIQDKARQMGINPDDMGKFSLIRAIQRAEGFESCYGTRHFSCKEMSCCWREFCQGKFHKIIVV